MEVVINVATKECMTVEEIRNDGSVFFNNSVVIYGPTNSGKTSLLKTIMYMLRHAYPIVSMYTPNHAQKHEFTNIIPEQLIYDDENRSDDLSCTNDTITTHIANIYKRQREIAKKYQEANMPKNIIQLYSLTKTINDDTKLQVLEKHFGNDPNKLNDYSMKYMRFVINRNKHHLTDPVLVQMHKNLKLNPKTLVIFDDASVKLNELLRSAKKNAIINKFFYEGRHQYITHFYAVHNTTVFPTQLRQNTNINIFCHRACASAWFENKNNADKYLRDIAKFIIDKVFEVRYRALVYHSTENKFYFISISNTVPKFTMCSQAVWDFCTPLNK